MFLAGSFDSHLYSRRRCPVQILFFYASLFFRVCMCTLLAYETSLLYVTIYRRRMHVLCCTLCNSFVFFATLVNPRIPKPPQDLYA